jgi:glycosyltransferase involved in cell wall biosynthesis
LPPVAETLRDAAPEVEGADERLRALRRVAIVPAYNEEGSIGTVVDEIRAADPEIEVVVVDDGSRDRTVETAAARGARVIRLPFNLGIGGAVQTGYRYAHDGGFDLALRVDGDGQHDASQFPVLARPVVDGHADVSVGSRFIGRAGYRSSRSRRLAIRVLSWTVTLIVGGRVTDPTSGFQVANRRAIALFAAHYPHDYPEVEATVLAAKAGLRRAEVPVEMRERSAGRSSIGAVRSVYYMVKVMLALLVSVFRRSPEVPET